MQENYSLTYGSSDKQTEATWIEAALANLQTKCSLYVLYVSMVATFHIHPTLILHQLMFIMLTTFYHQHINW